MTEPEVVYHVRRFLSTTGLLGRQVALAYTDAHPTLTADRRLRPFQRFFIQPFVGDASHAQGPNRFVHPDIVGLLDDGESLFAIEAKGTSNIPEGAQQASSYQSSVHSTWLAAPHNALMEWDYARKEATDRGVGLLGVHSDGAVDVLTPPRITLPTLSGALHVRAHFSVVSQMSAASTYPYNLPSRYLAPLLVMDPVRHYSSSALADALSGHAVLGCDLEGIRAVLSGSRKLGVVASQGRDYHLTPLGIAARLVLKAALPQEAVRHLARLHDSTKRSHQRTLAQLSAPLAGVLQLLLFRDPSVALVVQALRALDGNKGTERDLARSSEAIDPAVARVLFVTPERLNEVSQRDGRVDWATIPASAYRDTTSNQFRMVLQHAGILAGARGSRDPALRVWALAPPFWNDDCFRLASPVS